MLPSTRSYLPAVSLVVALAGLAVALHHSLSSPDPSRHELTLTDPSGRARVRLAAADNGGTIELLDVQGQPLAVLRQDGERLTFDLAPQGDEAAVRLLVAGRARGVPVAAVQLAAPAGGRMNLEVSRLGGDLNIQGPKAEPSVSVFVHTTTNSTGVEQRSGPRKTTLSLSKDTADLMFSQDGHPASDVTLRQTSYSSSLVLEPPGRGPAEIGRQGVRLLTFGSGSESAVVVDGTKLGVTAR